MNTQERVEFLVKSLQMQAHPEGGFYREIYRSPETIETDNGKRNLSTAIYFLLTSENISRFHRIQSDELWFWHEGSPLSVHTLSEEGHQIMSLGPANEESCQPQRLVQAKTIFGSSVDSPDSYALVSCVVSPGFDFEDFELFSTGSLLALYPEEKYIIHRLT
ncbi:cupin domain-containing protein [Algoriphagus algorifonticola]|uniref:cupin domain-containing protein n=1 Tax=Algoriphagus algorifonticola TaxID=2593007 RepID=UPI0011A7F2B6|nr:cupin domain-containing protein [Algoriphagus algorifonticola]